jgi:hypothetical protein
VLVQWAYLSTRWWLTVAAADPLDLLRRLEACAGERLLENVIHYFFKTSTGTRGRTGTDVSIDLIGVFKHFFL